MGAATVGVTVVRCGGVATLSCFQMHAGVVDFTFDCLRLTVGCCSEIWFSVGDGDGWLSTAGTVILLGSTGRMMALSIITVNSCRATNCDGVIVKGDRVGGRVY